MLVSARLLLGSYTRLSKAIYLVETTCDYSSILPSNISTRRERQQPTPKLAILALATLLALAPTTSVAKQPQSFGTYAETGRILVMPKPGLPADELDRILAPHGGKARKVGQSDLHIVELPSKASERNVAKLLAKHPHLKFVEVDERVAPHFTPNDPYLGSQWHLWHVGAAAAWDATQGSGITIAILDTGVEGTHPDLSSRMVPGWNFYDNTADTSDVVGHGTAVAGTAAASTDNSAGVASMAGQAKLMPIRISDATGYAYFSTMANGLVWAADHGARIANISFAGAAGSTSVQSAAQYMKDKGGLVIVSAGNNGVEETIAPSTALIPVAATDGSDMRASWSSYGSFVALSAPGTGIYTTSRGAGYGSWSGTSFSSPLTAGVVALMMASNPSLSGAQVESLLFGSAVDIGAAGRDPVYGYGRVDAARAVGAARTALTAVDILAPTASVKAPLGNSTVAGLVPIDVSASDDIGVARVELQVNGATVAIDSAAPFSFAWDSTGSANGATSLTAVAFDAAGNAGVSSSVVVHVANATAPIVADAIPPAVKIINPIPGRVTKTVTISTNASDNLGGAGIRQFLYIDGVLKSNSAGTALAYSWNTNKISAGLHTIQVVAKDAAGNSATSAVQVTR